MLEKMKALAREKDICVLATVSGSEPHCSLMAYVTDDDCREIYMVTYKQTQKYRNMKQNPSVSLLIDTRDEDTGPGRLKARALTVHGVFQEIRDTAKRDAIRAKLIEKQRHLKEFANHPDAEVFSVKIESLLLLNGLTDAHFETFT